MQIYISKNNQQLGPLEEDKVLEMVAGGELSPNDTAIRRGDAEWRKLKDYFPNVGKKTNVPAPTAPVVSSSAVAPIAPKKSRKGLLLGCGGFLLIGLLTTSVLGFFAYRNMNPADSLENLPDAVGDLKLDKRYPPKGNVWGTETNFVGIYQNASKTESVIYMMTIFKDEETAKRALREGLAKTCQTGEKPMYFSFLDDKKIELSEGATCAVPLYVQKDERLAVIGGSGGSAEVFIEFAEALPFNKGAAMKKKE